MYTPPPKLNPYFEVYIYFRECINPMDNVLWPLYRNRKTLANGTLAIRYAFIWGVVPQFEEPHQT